MYRNYGCLLFIICVNLSAMESKRQKINTTNHVVIKSNILYTSTDEEVVDSRETRKRKRISSGPIQVQKNEHISPLSSTNGITTIEDLPSELLDQILLYLIDWQAISNKEAAKKLVPLKRVNRRWYGLVTNIEKRFLLNDATNYFWRMLVHAKKAHNDEKIEKCVAFLATNPKFNLSTKESITPSFLIPFNYDALQENVHAAMSKKIQDYVQTVLPEYRDIAKKFLIPIKAEKSLLYKKQLKQKNLDYSWYVVSCLIGLLMFNFNESI